MMIIKMEYNVDSMEKKRSLIVLSLIAVFVISVAGYLFFSNRQKKGEKTTVRKVEEKVSVEKRGEKLYSATLSALRNSFRVGEEVELEVFLTSGGEDVTGFDLVLKYPVEQLEFKAATSVEKDFTVSFFDAKEKGYVAITGVKSPSAKSEYVFKNTKIVVVKFLVKKPGKVFVELTPHFEREVSQIVNTSSQKFQLSGDKIDLTVTP